MISQHDEQSSDADRELIVSIKAKGNRYLIQLDNGKQLKYHKEVVIRSEIKEGTFLNDSLLKKMIAKEQEIEAHESAIRLLSFRARSVKELKERLQKKGLSIEIINKEIDRLHNVGLLNDLEFAKLWVADRGKGRAPRSRQVLKFELRQHGIKDSILEKILDEIDDNENALQLARKKARSLTETEKNVFQKKIYANLKRKGFDYETIQRSVTTVWKEMNETLEEKR